MVTILIFGKQFPKASRLPEVGIASSGMILRQAQQLYKVTLDGQ